MDKSELNDTNNNECHNDDKFLTDEEDEQLAYEREELAAANRIKPIKIDENGKWKEN